MVIDWSHITSLHHIPESTNHSACFSIPPCPHIPQIDMKCNIESEWRERERGRERERERERGRRIERERERERGRERDGQTAYSSHGSALIMSWRTNFLNRLISTTVELSKLAGRRLFNMRLIHHGGMEKADREPQDHQSPNDAVRERERMGRFRRLCFCGRAAFQLVDEAGWGRMLSWGASRCFLNKFV